MDSLELAKAERDAEKIGLCVGWEPDDDADLSWMDAKEAEGDHTAEWVAVYEPEECTGDDDWGETRPFHGASPCASVGGVVDADSGYRRLVEAELKSECLHNMRHRQQKGRFV